MDAKGSRVLLVTQLYKPWKGGVEVCVENLSCELKKRSIGVQIVTRRFKKSLLEEEVIDDIPVQRILPNIFWSIKGYKKTGLFITAMLLAKSGAIFRIYNL